MSFSARIRTRLKKAISPRPWQSPAVVSKDALTDVEAYAIGVEAYLYLCPLLLMDLTRRAFINRAPMNRFEHAREFPDANFRAVVRPNFDTLFSIAWLDLRKQAQVVSVPDTGGRYYLLQMLDMWTDTFASVGKRTTGTKKGHYAIVPPGWHGTIPGGVERIDSPTWYVWIIGRTYTNGPKDFPNVHRIQNQFQITPLTRLHEALQRFKVTVDPAFDMKTPPFFQLRAMPAASFLGYAAQLMQVTPPHVVDQPTLVRLRRIGFEPGKPFDFGQLSPSVKQALEQGLVDTWKGEHTKAAILKHAPNGWQIYLDGIGSYGTSYVRRAAIAVGGLGANRAEDSVYPSTYTDSDGNPLNGSNRYIVHFTRDQIPPVKAFWSLTLYDVNGFPIANPINRFALGDRDPLRFNSDGSLTLSVQNAPPQPDQESNWLPAPKGDFILNLRLYDPDDSVLNGTWTPPPVTKAS